MSREAVRMWENTYSASFLAYLTAGRVATSLLTSVSPHPSSNLTLSVMQEDLASSYGSLTEATESLISFPMVYALALSLRFHVPWFMLYENVM